MSAQDADWRGHALNNLLCKIVGSAELALDRVGDPGARRELEAIIQLAEAGALLVKSLVAGPPAQAALAKAAGAPGRAATVRPGWPCGQAR